MTEAERAGILAWMDKQIELDQEIQSFERYNQEIAACTGKFGDRAIHIYRGLEKIAEAAGTEVMWQDKTRFKIARFNVKYKDYIFFATELRGTEE